MDEETCRICRGEATDSQPLFFPCKCRGSIKYIHQDCLEEWLKHSNKKDTSCDICHQQYTFTTQYMDDTPDFVPFRLILYKWQQSATRWLRYALGIFGLVVGCGIQIPLFYAAVSRSLTYLLNNVSVHEHYSVALVFGDYEFSGEPWTTPNVVSAVWRTYRESLFTILILIAINLVFFLLNEKISADTGFLKLVEKNIGSPKKPAQNFDLDQIRQLFNMDAHPQADQQEQQQQQQQQQQHPGPVNDALLDRQLALLRQRLDDPEILAGVARRLAPQFAADVHQNPNEQVQGLLNELLADDHMALVPDQRLEQDAQELDDRDLIQQMEEHQRDLQMLQQPELLQEHDENSDIDPDFIPAESDWESIHSADSHEVEQVERFLDGDFHRDMSDDEVIQPVENLDINNNAALLPRERMDEIRQIQRQFVRELINPPPEQQHFPPIAVPMRPFVPPMQQRVPPAAGVPRPPLPPVAPVQAPRAAQARLQDDFDQDALLMNLPTPVIIIAADLILALYLLAVYFMPTLIGTALIHVLFYSAHWLKQGWMTLLTRFGLLKYLGYHTYASAFLEKYSPDLLSKAYSHTIAPLFNALKIIHLQEQPLTNVQRLLILGVFFATFWSGVYGTLERTKRNYQRTKFPISGIQRKSYIVLFGLLSTIKVFTIFAIELTVFPAFCGMLLVFVFSPLFSLDSNWILEKRSLF